MTKGQRYINGRCYMLFCALDWWDIDEVDIINLEREVNAAKKQYQYVRVIKDRRRFRAYVYVL
jgi:hypothetical protein